MKHRLVICLLLSFMSNYSFATCADSVSVQFCKQTSTYSTSYNKTVDLFDSAGLVTSSTYYYLENNTWKPSSRTLYAYDGNGRLIERLNQHAINSGYWDNLSRYFWTFNLQGQVDSFLTQSYDGVSMQNSSYVISIFDTASNLIEKTSYRWINAAWVRDSRFLFYRDSDGNDTLRIEFKGDTLGWNYFMRTYSFFDINNQLVHDSIQLWKADSSLWRMIGQDFVTYTGVLTDSLISISYNAGGGISQQYYYKYVYDSLDRLIEQILYSWNGSQWNYDYSYYTSYDQYGNVSYIDGQSGTFNYLYDSLGNKLHEDALGGAIGYQSSDYTYSNGLLVHSHHESHGIHSSNTIYSECDYAQADIEGQQHTCGNSYVTLKAVPCTGGHQFLWTTGDTTSSINASTPGIYTVTVTYPSGFTSTSFDYEVFNSPPPSISLGSDTVVCDTQAIVLDAGSGFDYLWNDSTTFQTNTVSISSAINDTAVQWVTITDSNGCNNSDTIQIVFTLCNGIFIRTYDTDISVYPNPATNGFTINNIQPDKNTVVEVRNVFGVLVYSESVNGMTIYNNTLKLPTGIYFICLKEDNRNIVRQLVFE